MTLNNTGELEIHLCLQWANWNSDSAEFVFSTEEYTGSNQYFSIQKPQGYDVSYAVRMQSAFAAL